MWISAESTVVRSGVQWLGRIRAVAARRPAPPVPDLVPDRPLTVLALCTGSSARAVIAEALCNHLGQGRLRAHSASRQPSGCVDPLVLRVLAEAGIPTPKFYSQGWRELHRTALRAMDLVITLSDATADETCPWWRGAALRTHWHLPDPAAFTGTPEERLVAFRATRDLLRTRVLRLVQLVAGRPTWHVLETELRRLHD